MYPKLIIKYMGYFTFRKEMINMHIEEYWNCFLIQNKISLSTPYFEAFYFGYDQKSADNLLKLVLSGKKTATSSAQEEYSLTGEKEPQVGDYSIVTNYIGEPKCIIQTTKVKKLKFKDMTYELCKLEGEDAILKTWQDTHIDFFNVMGQKAGYTFHWDMIIIFEQFTVVYK